MKRDRHTAQKNPIFIWSGAVWCLLLPTISVGRCAVAAAAGTALIGRHTARAPLPPSLQRICERRSGSAPARRHFSHNQWHRPCHATGPRCRDGLPLWRWSCGVCASWIAEGAMSAVIVVRRRRRDQGILLGTLCLLAAGCLQLVHAAEPTPPRIGQSAPRSGTTQKFGSGTLTHRSDGSSSRTQPFGSGSITTERSRDGKSITGHTQPFGSSTITRWSDGTTTRTQPFGSGSITTEQSRDGRTVTGHSQRFGSGTIERRSDGSTSRSQPFGSGTLRTDQPGAKAGKPQR